MKWKGIVIAGGRGTRLYPITYALSKQLIPVYDKPMIYYPISVLLLAGIKDILLISTPEDIGQYKKLLGDGTSFGINLSYETQLEPNGIPEAFKVGEDFIKKSNVCLILGDNIFYGQGMIEYLKRAKKRIRGATIFSYQVANPSEFGVVEFNKKNIPTRIVEKPKKANSNHAITGLYFYDNNVVNYAKKLKPSSRGELEISSLNQIYLEKNLLKVETFGRGFAWLDTGTHENLIEAGKFISIVEKRQGLKVACLEEISYKNGWIDKNIIQKTISKLGNNEYGNYLKSIIQK